jgi:hypothetical protein
VARADRFERIAPGHLWSHRAPIVGRRMARLLRRAYSFLLAHESLHLRSTRRVEVTLVMLACDRDLPEAVVALRSFWREVGAPVSCVIVWDGPVDQHTRATLEGLDPAITVVVWTEFLSRIEDVGPVLADYAMRKPMGKKLVVELGLEGSAERPLVYMDSDVVFLPGGGADFRARIQSAAGPLFMEDMGPAFDERMVEPVEQLPPANGGLFILTGALDWAESIERLERLDAAESGGRGWTEQAALHIALRGAGGRPLPTDRYLLRLDDWDRFFGDEFRGRACARHYVTAIRWKMWLVAALTDLAVWRRRR